MKAGRFLIPNVEDLLEYMNRSSVFSKPNMFSWYWQMKLPDHLKEIAAFTSKYYFLQLLLVPFSVLNVSAMFQHISTELFDDLDSMKVSIDDVLIHSSSMEEHTGPITVDCRLIRWTWLELKLNKCSFAKEVVETLENIVSSTGIKAYFRIPDSIAAAPFAKWKEEIWLSLTFCSIYLRFVVGFA